MEHLLHDFLKFKESALEFFYDGSGEDYKNKNQHVFLTVNLLLVSVHCVIKIILILITSLHKAILS